MTRNKMKMRKHELKRQAYLAGLTTMAVGAVALSSGFVHADEQSVAANSSNEVSLVTKQEANQTNQEQTGQDTTSVQNSQAGAKEQEQSQVPNDQRATNEGQSVTESQKVSSVGESELETKPEVNPSQSDLVKSEVIQEVSQKSKAQDDSGVKRMSVATTVVKPATAATDSTYTRPVQGPISAGFNGYPGHGGIDYAVPEGTPVHAARDGVVKIAGANHPWMGWQGGNAVLIQHPDGMHTGYAHLSRIIVSVGQQVSQGQVIGYSGSTGLVTGPHLHFEMLPANPNFRNGYSGRIDPTPYISNAPFKASPTPTVNRYDVGTLAAKTDKTISDGDYHIVLASNPKYGVDVENGNSKNGTNVQLYQNTQKDSQIFSVGYLGNGYYKLIFKATGKALDVSKGSRDNKTNVQTWDYTGVSAQQWIIKQSDGNNTYEIISRNGGLALDVSNGIVANNNNLQMYSPNRTASQKFKFIAVDKDAKRTIADGDYHIVSALDEKLALDVENESQKDGANIQIYPNLGNSKETFSVKYLNNGYYSITHKYSGKMIDDNGDGAFNGNNISTITPNGSESQQWIIKDSAINGFFEIVSKHKNKLLDVTGGFAKPRTNVQLYVRNGSKSQAWKFVPVKKD